MTTWDTGTAALIADLEASAPSYERDELLERAHKLRYHDFDENGYDAPKVTLVRHLRKAGLGELAQHAMDGKYDQDKAAADDWEHSEEGHAVLDELRKP